MRIELKQQQTGDDQRTEYEETLYEFRQRKYPVWADLPESALEVWQDILLMERCLWEEMNAVNEKEDKDGTESK